MTSGLLEAVELPEFVGFGKIARLRRPVIVTEKIDGTNGQIFISDDGLVMAGSKNRWLSCERKGDDNFGFARWVAENALGLVGTLGPGRHYGEWYGAGIRRGYGLAERRFMLFNVKRWGDVKLRVPGLEVATVLGELSSLDDAVSPIILGLGLFGSAHVPGFYNPEGIVVHHVASGASFKYTLDGDGHKG